MIKREYKTKEECVSCMMEECFDSFPSWVVTDQPDFYERWTFRALLDEDEREDGEAYGYTHEPMWSTWFIPRDSYICKFIEGDSEKVMDCGFTIIYHDDEPFAIGVDGAGFSFHDSFFTPLYDALGFLWHE